MDAWPDYQIVITRPKKEVRPQATKYKASHALDVLCVGVKELKLGTGEKNFAPLIHIGFGKTAWGRR